MHIPWDENLTASLSSLAETPAVYWAKRSQLPWN
jgi:hypothetical protein